MRQIEEKPQAEKDLDAVVEFLYGKRWNGTYWEALPEPKTIPEPGGKTMDTNCHECKFCDKEALTSGRPCCTFAFKLEVEDSICLTRRQAKKEVSCDHS